MPRKRDVNLSHCGNAISRMWSPFGWVRNGVLARRETPRQGIRCLLPPEQIFPAAKVWSGEKRVAETQTAARMGGGGYHKVYLKMGTVLSGEPCDIFPDVINARVYLVDHLIMPETDNMPAQCFHQNIPMYVICLTASISVKMPSLAMVRSWITRLSCHFPSTHWDDFSSSLASRSNLI